MRFGRNRWGNTIEIFGKSIHIGGNGILYAKEILTAINCLKTRHWSLEFQDYNCESHYIPLIIRPGWADTYEFFYEGERLGCLRRDEIKKVCEDRISAEYYGMYI